MDTLRNLHANVPPKYVPSTQTSGLLTGTSSSLLLLCPLVNRRRDADHFIFSTKSVDNVFFTRTSAAYNYWVVIMCPLRLERCELHASDLHVSVDGLYEAREDIRFCERVNLLLSLGKDVAGKHAYFHRAGVFRGRALMFNTNGVTNKQRAAEAVFLW